MDGQYTGKTFPLSPFAPYDDNVNLYNEAQSNMGYGYLSPWEYTNWRHEVMSWKTGCYLHAGLNPPMAYRVTGPDAMKFFQDFSVNSFAKFPVGNIKHCIMCSASGNIMTHGVLMRTGEEEFLSYFLAPWAPYKLASGNYNATGEFIWNIFVLQVGGPKSLEIIEAATGECIHDIKFGRQRMSKINGMDVRIVRMGMAGTLAYEVQGDTKDVLAVYDALYKAGEPFGITKLGLLAYMMNHTEDGFPQSWVHFPVAWPEEPSIFGFLAKISGDRKYKPTALTGSMGPDLFARFRNPIELGWGKTIKFDHDFLGREALEAYAANPKRQIATLEWNAEDVADVYASLFRDEEPYKQMDPVQSPQENGRHTLCADQVLKNGKLVGVSSGRTYSLYYRKMISMASIDTEHCQIGDELTLIWGDPGTRQKEIRAKVARFPYLNENRNENVDVSTIPCQFNK
jgi:glycine cleavage system aminomethyltransferase T